MATTFRQDITAGLVTILDAFVTANPTLLRRTELAEPPSVMGDLPIAFVSNRPERIHHDSGIRQRTMSPSVLVVSNITDNIETVVRHDVLVDKLLDHFTTYPHIASNTVWEDMTVADEAYDVAEADGSVRQFYATRFTFEDVTVQEGRA
jgi:hypothetical protein